MTTLRTHIASRVAEISADAWDACFPGEAENHAYYTACETAALASGAELVTSAASIERDGETIAVAPFFLIDYRLDTPLQGPLRALGDYLFRHARKLVSLRVLCIGSPYAERCHIGLSPELDAQARQQARLTLREVIDAHGRDEGVHIIAWKDLAPDDAEAFQSILKGEGFIRLGSLPVAVLDLPFQSEADYLATLSAATRKDIRRKLAKAGDVRIEMRHSIADIEAEIVALYESTRAQSGLDYGDLEKLPPGYFSGIAAALGERALFVLYWVGTTLAAFNLLLIERERVIDKFLGMRYPLAREHNLYALSWMTNVRYCLAHGIGRLQSGQTAYASKLRFGSRLVPSVIFFRHRQGVLNWALRSISPYIAFDRLDPDLKAHRLSQHAQVSS
ncbi:GNAT family N-acetyltransferase [Bosea sp. 685]|uniref:GNAT family N-acetyltransferase n=1 Tax=Bosea sp. 685 TaxID=3080057 RepID=UPI0028937979|nr:GNAT family N-acetyltransferase [Bosea sp. 685]WNJ91122.1 GNAT family N-acetyltransferase [Bosea sp. 685]